MCGCSWVRSYSLATFFMGIGHEIISSAILPLLLFLVGLVVSYWPKDVHLVLVYA